MANEGPQASRGGSITIAAGSGTLTLTNSWENARWVRIIPVSEVDTYDFTIQDAEGLIMCSRTSMLGTFAEKLEMSLGIMKFVNILNASQNGTYQVRFDLH